MSVQYLPARAAPRARQAGGRLDQQEFARRTGLHPELVRRFVALGLVPAARDADGSLWFTTPQIAAVARISGCTPDCP